MESKQRRSAAELHLGRARSASRNALPTSVAAAGLLIAAAAPAYAAGATIGYSAPFLMSQFEVVLQDETVAAAKLGGLNVLSPTNADQDSGKQITDVQNLIGAGAKGLIVVANDSKAIIPALDFAASQKVPVVSIDIGPDGGKVYAIVRTNNVGMGWIACTDMAKAIGETGKVLSLQGSFASINGRERSQGFHDCMTKEHPKIELIERPTDWDAAKQAAALQTVLSANPDLKGIFQQSDYALSATLNVLKQAGRDAKVGAPGHIYDISIDAGPQSLALVRSGDLDAEISQPLDGYAKYGIKYLQDALAGKELALGKTDHGSEVVEFNGNKMDLLPAVLVTKANVDDKSLWGNNTAK
ncbi:MAG: sugar ABC transporter substrate-binding protein [Methylobacteriaceae bacterium]|nr:sugar ABC transporter substrate-binding protein [Methylobacteriaceae bacterium]MBV9246761.1 sugar ABC transporter substrate-binding protein [Methylobacteriaceae bacterium]